MTQLNVHFSPPKNQTIWAFPVNAFVKRVLGDYSRCSPLRKAVFTSKKNTPACPDGIFSMRIGNIVKKVKF